MDGSDPDDRSARVSGNLKAVRRTSLHEQIVAQIEALIEEGGLRHGDRLPTERRLAEIFKVSRHCVREAIRVLEEKKVLRSRVGSGTFVVTEDGPSVVEFLARAIQREKDKVADVFQFRLMIEPQISALAATNASKADLAELDGILVAQAHAVEDPEKSSDLDRAFHLCLAKATGNSILPGIVERISDILAVSRNVESRSRARRKSSLAGHTGIVTALKSGDSDRAGEAMREHLEAIEALVVDH